MTGDNSASILDEAGLPLEARRIDSEEQGAQAFETRTRELQPSLFATEAPLIPSSLRRWRKSISAIHSVPTRPEHAHTLNTHRLLDAAILIAQLYFRKEGVDAFEKSLAERTSPLFETTITQLTELAGIVGKNYERVREALDHLYEMDLRWNVLSEDHGVEFAMRAHFFSELGYGEGSKRGLIRFSISPSVLEIVVEPKHWATLSLEAQRGLGTPASRQLYQVAYRYLGTEHKLTKSMPVETWVELLVGPGKYITKGSGNDKPSVAYPDFKRRVLNEAIKRVNALPHLSHDLKLIEHRTGNRVTKLQFKFVFRPQARLALDMPLSWSGDVVNALKTFGFSEAEISEMSQGHSVDEVTESITRLHKADVTRREKGQPILSYKAYFQGILANVSAGVLASEIDDDKIAAEAAERHKEDMQRQRKHAVQEAFEKHQADVFKRMLFDVWEQDQRDALFARFWNSPLGQSAVLLAKPKEGTELNLHNRGLLAVLRKYLATNEPESLDLLLPALEDRTVEAWSEWRLSLLPAEA